ncbi:hypothetical protein GCM10007320_08610 [Pseudorhodoferax aquiterrae]|uniref:DUF4376 domain-containing protein n=1 Tax=Pseudorhodoferax aquiterrae TaxID=747304 RepID=A0ABQ3FXW9_9BURK|nr:DUF4376 domain-containing protein [Pseudorhodoferax aquiterrae]GHC72616.1 hypothetical protein GCM10007320_08610 [Pseudorhodoferax aquiterrae]
MSFWIEHDAEGRVFQLTEGVEAPQPFFGGTVVEIGHRVNTGTVLFLDGELVEFGPRPSDQHVKDAATRTWALVGTTALAQAQDEKWKEVKAERDRLETAGFPYLGKWIDSDARSVQRITGAVQSAQAAIAAGAPFAIGWTCSDNSVIDLDGEQMLGMTVALAAYANALHVTARGLRALIYAEDATEASVAAVAWPAEEGSS